MRDQTREEVVGVFHKTFSHPVAKGFEKDLIELRYKLIAEEYEELKEELAAALTDLEMYGQVKPKTKARLLKELADLQYVVSGFAVTFGLPLQVAFNRVHQSNMSKLGADGKPVLREDGKILKGPLYAPPDLEDLFEKDVPGYEYYNAV